MQEDNSDKYLCDQMGYSFSCAVLKIGKNSGRKLWSSGRYLHIPVSVCIYRKLEITSKCRLEVSTSKQN